MSDQKKSRIPIPESLTRGQYTTQEQLLAVDKKGEKLFIGIPRENILQENRIPLVPSAIRSLVGVGYRIIIETKAGEKSNFTDQELSEAGAEIVYSKEEVYQGEVILKVAPPTMAEVEMMRPNQILISPLHLPLLSAEYIQKLRKNESLPWQWNISKMPPVLIQLFEF